MAQLTRKDVEHIAHLSRLALTTDELDMYSQQLQSVVSYMDSLATLDCTGVEFMYNPSPVCNHVRADVAGQSLTQVEALAMAPAQEEGRFLVPQILVEE